MSTHRIMDKCHRRRPKREVRPAREGDENLGILKLLPGKWESADTGWNMIALPTQGPKFNYRLLMNQYRETLEFLEVDDNIPNRGILRNDPNKDEDDNNPDQFLIGLDYKQIITQVAAEDRMIAINDDGTEDIVESGLKGDVPSTIHHEPGLFLHMKDERTKDAIARRKKEMEEYADISLPPFIYGEQVPPLITATGTIVRGIPTSKGIYKAWNKGSGGR